MHTLSILLVLLAGILWGCLGLFVRILNESGLVAMDIVFLRALITCIAMALVLLIVDRKAFRIRWKDIWCFLGTGLCSIVFFNFCYFKSIALSSLSVAAILLYTAPAIVMVLSFFLFKEKLNKQKIGALLLTFVGCVLVTGVFSGTDKITLGGILFGLGSGFGYALYSIFSRYALERGYSTYTITFYTFLFAAVGSVFFTKPGEIFAVSVSSQKNLFLCIALGLLGTVIPYLAYTKGLQKMENGTASIIASIEPVTASILGVVVYHEKMGIGNGIGAILVLLALVLCNVKLQKR